MSPIKAMPLLLTVLIPFGMTAGVALAAEAPVIAKAPLIFAEYDPKKDEHKQQQQPASKPQPPHPQAPQAPHPQPPQPHVSAPPQPHVSAPPQPHVSAPPPSQQFQRNQGTSPDAAKLHAPSTLPGAAKPQGPSTSPDAAKLHGTGAPADAAKLHGTGAPADAAKLHGTGAPADAAKLHGTGAPADAAKLHGTGAPADAAKLHGTGAPADAAKLHGTGAPADAAKLHGTGAPADAAKLHGTGAPADAAKLHGTGAPADAAKLHGTGAPADAVKLHGTGTSPDAAKLQQANRQNTIPRHELSAEEKHAKSERDAHAADRTRLIEQQKVMATHEKSPAAVNERLRVQNERLHVIASQRQQSVDAHGQTIIKEPGNRTIVQVGGHAFIQHDETAHFHAFGGVPQTRQGHNGNSISTIVRPDGVRLEIEVDGHGRPLRRVRYLPDGRRFVLFENRALAIGAALAVGALIISLPPVEMDIPQEQYIVDADSASEDDIYSALQAGPVGVLDRGYSLEEVLASVSLRQRMRSINIDSINFDFGSADVPQDQAEMLESVAAVVRDMINRNPGEVFLVEGHTDAIGSEVDNLSLSDRRAEAIAGVLAQQFNIPRENLVTQGYGKQFLLVPTSEPERRNRRVVIRRVTPLLQSDGQYSAADGPADR